MTRPLASSTDPSRADSTTSAGDTSSPALRLIALLEHVARADKALTLTDIIGEVRQPKPTVYRMLQQLEQAGLLVKEPDGKRYAPGARLAKLAEDVLLNAQVRAARHAILQQLVDELGETCNYTMPAGTEVVYLDRVETAWPLRFHLQPGSRVPLHCSASGKLFMAWMPPVQRNRLLGHLQYKSYTPNTITTRIRLEAELARVRAQGYALDNEEYLDGLVCVAVPVFDPRSRQKVRGSVAVQAPASRFPIERAASALPALQRTALAFAQSLSEPGPERRERAAAPKRPSAEVAGGKAARPECRGGGRAAAEDPRAHT
ncbi:MAG: IclR family transcriptional regulator [Betaproteobacteria bacterium]|nr:IclR family transcriptional regulator [Betaproteobacteria bacterium]